MDARKRTAISGPAGDKQPADSMCSCAADCAATLKVIADSNRVLILRALIYGPLNVSEICAATGLPQQRVSHHLGRMRPAGIVTADRDGRNVVYQVSPRIAVEGGIDLGCCRLTFRTVPQLPRV
jgi:ArsR family transcriptional regulator